LADILPGPVAWYTMSYACGPSDGKIGGWPVVYREVGNLSGCLATAQFPDQTIFQMAQIQSGTDKHWAIFISNPRWNAWLGKRKELPLQLVTDWPTTKPWPYTFSISGDSKILSITDASVEFMNSVADASKVEIKDNNGALLASVVWRTRLRYTATLSDQFPLAGLALFRLKIELAATRATD